jgi:ABC-2 type transport system permease protein
MNSLSSMIWIEWRKAYRSRMPLWTALGSLFMPLGIAFLIYVARNPDISQKIGLISAKANLIAYSAADWTAYLGLFCQLIAAGGFILFILIISWVFGREFMDGALKDMLAVPVQRSTILLAKFVVVIAWSAALSLFILLVGLLMGVIIRLPGSSIEVIYQSANLILITSCLVIVAILPFALLASIGRGYLLPIGMAILVLMTANIVVLIGWGEYFPWAIPGLYGMQNNHLTPLSYWIVILTGMTGMIGTYLWWMFADQSR